MAVSAREVIMVFRGQNYLSSAVRRVSADVGGLTRLQQLQVSQIMAQSQARRLQLQKQAMNAEIASLRAGGTRRLALERTMLSNSAAMATTRNRLTTRASNISGEIKSMEKLTMQYKAASFYANNYMAIHSRMLDQVNAGKLSQEQAAQRAMTRNQLAQEKASLRERAEFSAQQISEMQQLQAIDTMRLQGQMKGAEQLRARERDMLTLARRRTEQLIQQDLAIKAQNLELARTTAALRAAPIAAWQGAFRTVEHSARVINMVALMAGATMGYMGKAFADFNTQATIAATQSTVAGKNTAAQVQKNAKAIQDAVMNLMSSGRTIAKPEELTQSVYEIFSGVSLSRNQNTALKQGIGLMKQFSDLTTANAGVVTMAESTQLGIVMINEFNVALKDVNKQLGIAQAAVRFGKMNMSQFISTLNQAAPAAKSVGYSFQQMATDISFLSRFFPSIRYASTGYARLTDLIARSRDAFEKQGVAVKKAGGGLLPMEQIITNLARKYPGLVTGATDLNTVFKQITGTTATAQARRAGTMMIQNLPEYRRRIKEISNDHNELQKSLQAAQASTGVTWAEFVNQLRAVVLVLGEGAIPALRAFGQYVAEGIKWFNGLSTSTKHAIGYFLTFTSLAALVVSTLGMIVGGIGSLIAGVWIWKVMRSGIHGAAQDLTLFARSLNASQVGVARLASERGAIGASLPLRMGLLVFSLTAFANIMQKTHGDIFNLHKDLDAMFSGWMGYTSTIGLATIAAIKLTTALKGLNLAAKGSALWNTISILGSSMAGRVAGASAMSGGIVPLAAGYGRTASGQLGRIETQMVMGKEMQMVRSSTGQFLGKLAPAVGGVGAAAGGAAMGLGGLAAAATAMLPMLAIGGGLIGGLYLWKRHMDAAAESARRLKAAQEFLNRQITRPGLMQAMASAGPSLHDLLQARLDYNNAVKNLKEASGDQEVAQARLQLSDATITLYAAQGKLNGSFKAFSIFSNKRDRVSELQDRLKQLTEIRDNFVQTGSNFNKPMPLLGSGRIGGSVFTDFSKIENVMREIGRIQKLLPGAVAARNASDVQVTKLIGNFVHWAILLNQIPKVNQTNLNVIVQWIKGLGHYPTIPQLQLFVKVAAKFELNRRGATAELQRRVAELMRAASTRNLTRKELNILVRLLFNIDPNSTNGAQIRAMVASYIAQVMPSAIRTGVSDAETNMKVAAGRGRIVENIINSIFGPELPQTRKRGGGGSGGLSKAAVNAKNWAIMARQVNEIVAADTRATQTHSAADWDKYFSLLNGYQKKWKDTNLDVFNKLLEQQESKLKDSAQKQATITTQTFDDVLSAVKNMYDGFLQQETSNFGQLFQGPYLQGDAMQYLQQWGYKPTGKDYLKDLRAQTSQYRQFNNVLDQFAKRGAPEGLLKQFAQAGPQSLPALRAILRDPKVTQEYFNAYKRSQALITRQAKKDLTAQLNTYRKFGQNVATAIITGIKSENQAMENVLRDMIKKMFPGLPVGATGAGGRPGHTVPKNSTKGNSTTPTRTPQSAAPATVNHNTTVHVTTTESASLEAKVRHGIFASRNVTKK